MFESKQLKMQNEIRNWTQNSERFLIAKYSKLCLQTSVMSSDTKRTLNTLTDIVTLN